MADFLDLRRRADLLPDYFRNLQNANDHYLFETAAATRLQALYRASKVRERWHAVATAARRIQRLGRGMLGRLKAKAALMTRADMCNMAYFNHCAVTLQKVFRGFWCRNYVHCMKTRTRYLTGIAAIGDRTNKWLSDYEQRALQEQKRQVEDDKRDLFNNLASGLHHLISTQTIPGVYNPPYSDAVPTAFNVPIEQHLRLQSTSKLPASLRRPNLNRSVPSTVRPLDHAERGTTDASKIRGGPPHTLSKRKPLVTRTANAGRLQEIQGPFRQRDQIDLSNAKAYDHYRSVQSQSEYHAVEKETRLQGRLSKLTRVGPDEWIVKKPAEDAVKPTVGAETRYQERPVEFRQDYTELPKIKDKPPFFTALPRDKDLQGYNEAPYITHAHP